MNKNWRKRDRKRKSVIEKEREKVGKIVEISMDSF